jgi:hypothetical protein
MSQERIFEQSLGLILDISIWSGSKTLKAEDFQGYELPPEELVSLGSKRLHSKDSFKPIQAVRTKAVSVLESTGISLYGGRVWIIPDHAKSDVEASLHALAAEFQQEKDAFLRNFYTTQEEWLQKNNRWASILRPYLDTPETVSKRFGFSWRIFRMGTAEQGDGLAETITDDLRHNLLREVATLAEDAYQSLRDRDRATPKNLNRLDKLADKLRGLSFVTPASTVIETELSGILDERDSQGALEGQGLFKLVRLMVQLKSPMVLNEVLEAAERGQAYQFHYPAYVPPVDTAAPQPQLQPQTNPAPVPAGTFVPPPTAPPKPASLPSGWF